MERAPFEWDQPATLSDPIDEFEPETPRRVDRPVPSASPVLGQPYVWAAPQQRPPFRYVDDTPKTGRAGSVVFLGFLVLLAFGAVWVVERDVEEPATTPAPVTQSAAIELPAEPPPLNLADSGSVNLEAGGLDQPLPRQNVPDENVGARPKIRPEPPAPRRDEFASQRAERRVPFPTLPPLSQQIMRTPRVEPPPAPMPVPAAAPARMAAAEAVPGPLPRVAVEEPVLAPPASPAPEAPPSSPSTSAAVPPGPAPSPVPPPAAAPATATRTPVVDVDNRAIRDTLGRYRNAFNALDAKAAQQVWPSVNAQTLDRAFGQLRQQDVSFDQCTIAVKGVLAEANCNGTTRFVPRVGSRSEQSEARQWNFSLRKAYSGGWVIQDVEAR